MISYNDRSNCKLARLHYYDLIDTETAAEVPDDVRQHIAACRHCQADMSRLEAMLADEDRNSDSEQRRRDSAVSKLLSLHFAWIDKPVTCKSARPFLASLADPLLRIVIPTPITVHIDKCRRCAEELSTIKNSGYTHKQLCHLGQTIAVQPAEDLAERDDSGIVTRFTFREEGDENVETESNENYVGWPIDVQVLSQVRLENSETAETTGSSAPKRGSLIVNLKQYIKPALAAAAVITIGLALFLGTSPARAVDLDQIRSFVLRAANIHIHITNFVGGKTESMHQEWVSRSLGIYMSKIGEEYTIWNLRTGPKLVQISNNGTPKEIPVTDSDVEAARRKIDSLLGIVPLENVSNTAGDAKWNRVPDGDLEFDTQGCEVYELAWTQRTMRADKIWRVFVEPGTNRPKRAQFLSKSPTDADYYLENELVIEYPDDAEIEAEVEAAFL